MTEKRTVYVGEIWKHYNGTNYKIACISDWSGNETTLSAREKLITYQELDSTHPIQWTQTLSRFLDLIEESKPRFTQVLIPRSNVFVGHYSPHSSPMTNVNSTVRDEAGGMKSITDNPDILWNGTILDI